MVSASETTTYQNVLERVDAGPQVIIQEVVDDEIIFNKRGKSDELTNEEGQGWTEDVRHVSSSSEELMDIDLDINARFIADCQAEARRRKRSHSGEAIGAVKADVSILQTNPCSARDKAEDAIREAEASRALVLATPGNYQPDLNQLNNHMQGTTLQGNVQLQGLTAMQHLSMVDECYLVIGVHIDSVTQEKIQRGEYVDFARLLPRYRMQYDDGRLEIVHKGGQAFFMSASEWEASATGAITSFNKWEQAFRIYSNIYSRAHPTRSTELIQYNHIIFTASLSYVWENVYTYDSEFRMHLANFPH